MGITAKIASIRRKPAHWRLATPAATVPASLPDGGDGGPIGLMVEIFVNSAWTDITSFVYYRDRIQITRGRSDETSQVPPQTCRLTLNNRDGRFSPRNRNGAYYQQLGRNTPLRVSRLNSGVRRYRFYGEVSAWPTNSDISGQDVYVRIQASGVLRRVRQGALALRSPMERAYINGVTSSLVTGYWPCEDGVNSTQFASALSSSTAMAISGTPTLAADTSFACSAPLPVVNNSTWTASVTPTPGGTANVLRFLLKIPAAGEADSTLIASMGTTGTIPYANLYYRTTTNGALEFIAQDGSGGTIFTLPNLNNATGVNGATLRVSMEILTSGSNITAALVILAPGAPAAGAVSNTVAGTVGQIASININPASAFSSSKLVNTVFGHVSYQPTWDSLFDLYGPLNAWSGEPPDAVQAHDGLYTTSRFTRLCLEQNINPVVVASAAGFDVDPGPAAPVGMGYQTIDTFPNLLQQAVDTTADLMFEPRDQLGIAVRTRASLYNQPARLTLDMSTNQLSAPLVPVDDDTYTRNDITVTRIGGSSATQQLTTGTLSLQPPPAGVGDYQTGYNLSLASDSITGDAAGWRLHVGTVDEPRYPGIGVNLRYPAFTGSVDLLNAALTLDIGDRLVIINPPAPEFPPDPISLIVQGYTETLGIFEHDMALNCSPESPYEIAILEDPVLGHADTDGSTLSVAILGSDVTFRVATTGAATGSPLWTTTGADFPFDVNIGGERMTVPNITGSSSPQFFTNVVRAVNGTPIPLGADGTFETGATGWTPTAGTLVATTAQAHSGTHSGLLTVTGSPSQTFTRTPLIPVTPGAAVAATQWVLTASGSPSVKVAIDFFDAGQNYQSTYSSSATAAPGTWTVQQSVATVPDGIAYAAIGPTIGSSPATGTAIYVDDVTFTIPPSHPAGADVRLWQPMILSL